MIDENIYELMKHSFGGAIQTIYVPSLKRTVPFKEPTVRENKLIAKVVIANRDSQSVMYAATLALIKGLCVESDFDQYSITEFDRLAILANLFSNNFLSKKIPIRCLDSECGHQFAYTVKHGDVIRSIESMDASDIVFENKTKDGDIRILVNFPTTKQYLGFLEFVDSESPQTSPTATATAAVVDKYDELNSVFSEIDAITQQPNGGNGGKASSDIQDVKIAEMIAKKKDSAKSSPQKQRVAGNVEIGKIGKKFAMMDTGDLYIRDIVYHINGEENDYHIVFDNDIGFEDRERILGMFPMSFLTNESGESLLDITSEEFSRRMKACVPEIVCPKCGKTISNAIGLQDFFMRG